MLGKGASGSEVLDLNTKEKRNGMDRRHWLLYRERKLRLGSQDQHQMDITLPKTRETNYSVFVKAPAWP